MNEEELKRAHTYSSYHKTALKNSNYCACFCCLNHIEYNDITQWIDNGQTALCYYCCIDAVLPSNCLYTTDSMLSDMYNYWFGKDYDIDGNLIEE